jgi:hypothetical protein
MNIFYVRNSYHKIRQLNSQPPGVTKETMSEVEESDGYNHGGAGLEGELLLTCNIE